MNTSTIQRFSPLLGRVFLAALFLFSGTGKLMDWEETSQYMAAQGMPLVPVFLAGAIALLMLGGLSLLLGYRARLGALALLVFLVPTTIIFHNPIGLEGMEQRMQLIQALKNLAISGGVLMVLAFGPGSVSLDGRRAS